ncbi:MAG: outer membrane protein assembly factor BamD [Planctomycetes bacterium]|nr:outer membrane protein assembly factor BamD [Planctomycetota bacterium]
MLRPAHPRSRPRLGGLGSVCLALLASCATVSLDDPDRELAAAEAALAAREPGRALAVLQKHDVQSFPSRLRDRFDHLRIQAHAEAGDPDAAFTVAETFADRHPHSDLRPQIGERIWQLAVAVLARDGGLWPFWSDRRSSRTMLEHLITRYPEHVRTADALRQLGDLAYDDRNHALAQERYRDLLRRCPNSEWVKYASFRYAMSLFAGLQGPDYDLDQIEHTRRELEAFLGGKPENPEFVKAAATALQQVIAWQAERHLRVAHFYRTIGNLHGQRLHLEIAAGAPLAGTAAHTRARTELAELPELPTPADPEVPNRTAASEARR